MIHGKIVLAVIPARGGSKGLPGKNIRPVAGKPLLAWSIEAGLQSRYVDYLVVSTDSPEIAAVAESHGAEAPFLRPDSLASDTAGHAEVMLHALDWMEVNRNVQADYLVMLEPTSPLRDAKDVDLALEVIEARQENGSLVGVCRTEAAHPAFLCQLENGFVRPFNSERFVFKRRQELDNLYFFEGSIYISKVSLFRTQRSFYHEWTVPFEVPKWKSFEVDDVVDLLLIERLLELKLAHCEALN
ncbi:cytidylyltransferase domain-containing protein [Geothrix sp. 21YS21S-4]|uniref:acylneuraminate cytidylyltransferase family protein n=1 Tax=Geothrix sp. 21YS21S-4 TaxID=3068889 RepID=UPI0027B95090|nr:acylneuraminate cytidylyltransferase family protein [Geothrix sp. 21YS21S-4]